jgi:hypothetical protein
MSVSPTIAAEIEMTAEVRVVHRMESLPVLVPGTEPGTNTRADSFSAANRAGCRTGHLMRQAIFHRT